MAYDEKPKTAVKPHNLSLEDRSRLSVTGVEDVESFDETVIVMNTAQGGELRVEGLISDLSYEEKTASGGFWSKLFG